MNCDGKDAAKAMKFRTKYQKLDKLIVERGSQTLIHYIMTSMKSVLGAVDKTTGELISQL